MFCIRLTLKVTDDLERKRRSNLISPVDSLTMISYLMSIKTKPLDTREYQIWVSEISIQPSLRSELGRPDGRPDRRTSAVLWFPSLTKWIKAHSKGSYDSPLWQKRGIIKSTLHMFTHSTCYKYWKSFFFQFTKQYILNHYTFTSQINLYFVLIFLYSIFILNLLTLFIFKIKVTSR